MKNLKPQVKAQLWFAEFETQECEGMTNISLVISQVNVYVERD